MEPSLGADLAALVATGRVLTGAETEPFAGDWTGAFKGTTPAVVQPGSADEIAAVLAYCTSNGLAVIPQGGNTGLVGGGAPMGGEIVLSLVRLTHIETGDAAVTAGAGASLGAIQEAVAPQGRHVPLDLASRDSATAGGIVATNAGGMLSFRYGRAGRLVEDMTVVTTSGDALSGDEAKNLGIGREGTLGVIASVTFRTVPLKPHRVTALAGFSDPTRAVRVATELKDRLPSLEICEFVTGADLVLTRKVMELGTPFDIESGFLLLLECADLDDDPTVYLGNALRDLDVDDVVVAQGADQTELLWKHRDLLNEALHRLGPPLKLDVRISPDRLGSMLSDLRRLVTAGSVHVFGHLLEGHMHVNLLDVPEDERPGVEESVLRSVVSLGGRVAGEHGVGRAKSRWLALHENDAALERFKALKAEADPAGILNPGVSVEV